MLPLRVARRAAASTARSAVIRFQRPQSTSAALGHFPGTRMPLSGKVEFRDPINDTPMSCFRVVGVDGEIVPGAEDPELGQELMLQLYTGMVQLNTMDHLLYDAQRQGRISFYATALGEEAVQFGSAAALPFQDMVFGQYREPGVLMWRGYTVQEFVDQCYCNADGHTLGRQTPMHYGSQRLNFQTISSPLATQIPHAVGAAYGFKLTKEDRIAVTFFGDGASSEGDCHAALNFAATKDCPVLFICRNNGYAISTPTSEQYRSDGIASRGSAYGIASMRVDGNDVIAVHVATRMAREFIREKGRPVLLEIMTYRQGHHSTSDDSTLYRDLEEMRKWTDELNPIDRTKKYLMRKGWLSKEQDEILRDDARLAVIEALAIGERKPLPALETMFSDVLDKKPPNLLEQERELMEHLSKYPDHYRVNAH